MKYYNGLFPFFKMKSVVSDYNYEFYFMWDYKYPKSSQRT